MAREIKGWFDLPNRPGDRKFEDQLKGLDEIFEFAKGKHVLDAGCAEGLISLEFLKRAAASVHGIELVPGRVALATKFAVNRYTSQLAKFEVGDMNTWRPSQQYDVVIGLAILHKLKDPGRAAVALANAAREWVVWRLPPATRHVIVDRRSGHAPVDIKALTEGCGFVEVSSECDGPLGEWIGYYKRVA